MTCITETYKESRSTKQADHFRQNPQGRHDFWFVRRRDCSADRFLDPPASCLLAQTKNHCCRRHDGFSDRL